MIYKKINENTFYFSQYGCIAVGSYDESDLNAIGSIIDNYYKKNNITNNFEFVKENYDSSKMKLDYIYPNSYGICLTDLCQFRCNYCSFTSTFNGNTISQINLFAYIDYAFRKAILKKHFTQKDDTYVSFYYAGGGEPTYDWSMFKRSVEYIRKKEIVCNVKAFINMTTNGFLNDDKISFISKNIDYILISFDGCEELQNQNRKLFNGNTTFDVVNHCIDELSKTNIPIELRATIWPKDFGKIKSIYLNTINNYPSVFKIDIEPVIPVGRARNPQFNVDKTSLKDYNTFVNAYIETKKFIYENKLDDVVSCGKFKDTRVNFLCGTIFGFHPWLIPNGDIITCLDAKENATLIGKVKNGKVFLNEYCDKNAYVFINNMKKCKKCIAFAFCGSGCPLRVYSKDCLKISKLECAMIRKYWMLILKKINKEFRYLGWELCELPHELTKGFKIYNLEKVKKK